MKHLARTLLCLTLLSALNANAQPERPRLVVGIVVDQMRWDFLYTFHDQWRSDGFRRLLEQGFSCANTMIDYVPTVTACGHASVYTGTTPAVHGIAGNNYKINGINTSSVRDNSVTGVGTTTTTGQRSPRNLLVTTLGDELKLATRFQARVIGIALKDRAAILPAGHAADAAYWWDGKAPGFISSTYYMEQLPKWVSQFNSKHKNTLGQNLMLRQEGVTMTFDLAIEALKNEQLGQDGVTDLLAISISTTDAAAHKWGTRSTQLDTIYRQLDTQIARLLTTLDQTVGQGNYLLFLTADHGGTHNEPFMTGHKLPSGRFYDYKLREATNKKLSEKFHVDNLITDAMEYSFYLNNHAIDSAELDRDDVAREVCRILEADPTVQWAVDIHRLADKPIPAELRERIIKGYHAGRSGEIFVQPYVGHYASWDGDIAGSNHGTWNQSDSHIPLIFYGWHIPHGERTQPNGMIDIAPTIAAMLHIQAPDGTLGKPIPIKPDN